MKYILAVFALVTAGSAFGQQNTTDTTCNVNGQQVNCTSTDNSAANAAAAQQQKDIDENMNKLGNAIGSAIGNKILKKRINKWCEGHPEGSWNFPNGQNVTCFNWNEAYQPAANAQLKAQHTDQMLTIAVASWTFCKAHPDQSWTGPISGKVTPCGQLIALEDAACSRNPGLDYCKAIAASATAQTLVVSSPATASPPASVAPVPVLTKEQKDEIAYCQRNPSATATRIDGTVISCATILGNSH